MQIALIADRLSPPGPADADPYPLAESAGVLSLARALAAAGQDVTVYARRDHPDAPETADLGGQVNVRYLSAGPAGRLTDDELLAHVPELAAQLAGQWRGDPPAVAHGFSWSSGMAALAGARDLDVRVVQTYHRPEPGRATAAPTTPARLEAAADRTADAVLAPHPAAVTELGRIGVPRTAVKLVPGGVDISVFQPEGPVAERGDHPRLLMISPMTDPAELEIAVRTLAHLPGAELVLAGGDEPARQAANRVITKLSRELDVQDRVVVAGELSAASAPPLMRSADVVITLAAQPPWDRVALDAMACGVPVLAGPGPVHEDVVIDGVTGFLLPSGTPRLLADRTRSLLASPMQREGYRIAAASRARERYAWERIGAETLAVYLSLSPRGADVIA
jgi:glycosyltransferase involved in cell wall biosynthesis